MGKKPDRDDELDAARTAMVARKFAWLKHCNADRKLKPHSAFRVAAAIIDFTRFHPGLRPEDHVSGPASRPSAARRGSAAGRFTRA